MTARVGINYSSKVFICFLVLFKNNFMRHRNFFREEKLKSLLLEEKVARNDG